MLVRRLWLLLCSPLLLFQSVCSGLFPLDFIEADGEVVDTVHRQLVSAAERIKQGNLGDVEDEESQLELPASHLDGLLLIRLTPDKVEVNVPVVHDKHVEILLVVGA